jgi:DNA topoisomerase-1
MRPQQPPAFLAGLKRIDGEKVELDSENEVMPIVEDMRRAEYRVTGLRRGKRTRKPSAPFITSTLQQDASRRLGYSARRTMAIAQQLYEGMELGKGEAVGLITYMRSDSTHIAQQAVNEARKFIGNVYGERFLPEKPPIYRTRARGAQEAHEAIRPTSVARTPEETKQFLRPEQQKLYVLIWQRFVASQMRPAEYETLKVDIAGSTEAHKYQLRFSASSLKFPGYLRAYPEQKKENSRKEGDNEDALLDQLPELEEGDSLVLNDVHSDQHFTQAPPRFSEASLVRALEEHGIGRPSTYAPIMGTLVQRGYVERVRRRLIPTEIGEVVNGLLVEHFPEIVDIGFTARMEDKLDEIAKGEQSWVDVVKAFYDPFAIQIERAVELMPEVKSEPEVLDRLCPEDEGQLLVRHGRFGRFVGCSNFPACRYTEPWLEKIGVHCPKDGGEIVQRRTRKGRTFYGCANYPQCDFTSWKRPLTTACPECSGMLVKDGAQEASCQKCEQRFSLEALKDKEGDLA